MLLENSSRFDLNLLVSHLKNVEGTIKSDKPFLIKNVTGDDIVLTVLMAADEDPIETVFQPGWNVEIVNGVYDVEPGTIQIGY